MPRTNEGVGEAPADHRRRWVRQFQAAEEKWRSSWDHPAYVLLQAFELLAGTALLSHSGCRPGAEAPPACARERVHSAVLVAVEAGVLLLPAAARRLMWRRGYRHARTWVVLLSRMLLLLAAEGKRGAHMQDIAGGGAMRPSILVLYHCLPPFLFSQLHPLPLAAAAAAQLPALAVAWRTAAAACGQLPQLDTPAAGQLFCASAARLDHYSAITAASVGLMDLMSRPVSGANLSAPGTCSSALPGTSGGGGSGGGPASCGAGLCVPVLMWHQAILAAFLPLTFQVLRPAPSGS